uniref:Uncharacterized protein n=1 Tax=Rhizophora mucronata TaxID=61149 RepID=A0A2P2PV60_RHIMU
MYAGNQIFSHFLRQSHYHH